MGNLTLLLAAVRAGEPAAVDRLVAATYRELHSIAHQRLSRTPTLTLLDTTALVHECYLKLVNLGELQATDRSHFMGYAARAMRSIVVDMVRRRMAERRGGGERNLTLGTDIGESLAESEQVLRVDGALEELAKLDQRLVEVVELRYFAGLTNEEIAETLGVNERTVRRAWDKARMLLHRELLP
jgi:RNA polymerase sigma factor (TIGR02999 family)